MADLEFIIDGKNLHLNVLCCCWHEFLNVPVKIIIMRFKFLIIPSVLLVQAAAAQNNTYLASGQTTEANGTAPNTVTITEQASTLTASPSGETAIIDYKSVYESATTEEEVKMATERFSLSKSQADVWLTAATDRRAAEKTAQDQLALAMKDPNVSKDAVYKGLRASQNSFYETIIGYMSPSQKQSMENDRIILEEKRKRIAKLPPPAPVVVPVDSTAIKADLLLKQQEAEKAQKEKDAAAKKSKKKKKPVVGA